jgi:branched-chain amino acid transport system ATP-binding protein
MADEYVLQTRGLTKDFRGFTAVKNVNLSVRRGTIHALIGPNGAGKTTCFNLITKFLLPTAGTILYKGRDITRASPHAVARQGLVRSFQISAVFPHLTVLENVRVALQRALGTSYHFWRSERTVETLNGRAMELLDDVGVSAYAELPAVELPYGRKRALEIATTLALDPEMLLLDEPMAGMGTDESQRMIRLLASLKGRQTIILVEHDMDAVFRLADRISVLVYGRVIASGSPEEVRANPEVRAAYLGEEA